MKSDFVGIGEADLISSAKQISSEQSEDFIALCAISFVTGNHGLCPWFQKGYAYE